MIRLLLLAAALPLAAQTPLEWDPTSPGAAQIDSYLQQKGSAMAGIGAALENLARQYNLDPRLIVAIAGAESTFGKHVCATNNAWNWFHRGSCPPSTFSSYEEGLEHVTKFMRRSYLNKGYTSVPLIRQKYCTSGCDNWVPLVTQFQAEMPAGQSQAPSQPPTQAVEPPALQPAQPALAKPSPAAAQKSTPGRVFGLPIWAMFFAGALLAAALAMRMMKGQ
jgi:hypothetical protein